jgi:hypothetical protein
VTVTDDDYIKGAPELVAEVASSSVSFDLSTKFNVYRRCGVKEYIVGACSISQLTGLSHPAAYRSYRRTQMASQEPGLSAAAMLRSDLTRVSAVLQFGLASAEHAQFVKKLTASA